MKRALVMMTALAACGDDTPAPAAPDTSISADAAPVGCPATGRPRFVRERYDVVAWTCGGYSESRSANLALVRCGSSGAGYELRQGPIGGSLAPIGTLAPTGANATAVPIALFPEGDRLLVRQSENGIAGALSVYVPAGGGWTWSYDIPLTVTYRHKTGNVSAGPVRRMFISEDTGPSGSQDLVEYEGDGTSWVEVLNGRYHPLGELGYAMYGAIDLSPDGLRMIYDAGNRIAFAQRPSLDARFGPAQLIDEVVTGNAFLTEDCDGLYFSGLGGLLLARQR